ncbi:MULTISPECIES: SDR family NAD(P)-dependent oxidoreductase [Streptomyces]|uniref:Beta-ketoacyl-ACP reductase n=1 Tax=Streptomyces spororaveus TaxID=284039 RepID=A0ABQ3T9P6_9ACTN|nr:MULTISPECIES: SDR family NAD(P)-dependent oxidoreductase [Streptomyces]MCM9082457.1 SDR family oxidoreductase [Streptomyces spororaveus]MCX5302968.1 SDR family oxidoreductase [Streptomyces sp. NBC_00160]GHI77127.1 beta-ketoacyl-ACP reductase [Streptomyces spororaveus]
MSGGPGPGAPASVRPAPDPHGLRGKAVLVTGATGGIGAAIARRFSAEGARVAVAFRSDREAAEKLAAELGAAEDRALAVRYALDEPGSPARAVAEVEARWGAVDVLVANAVRWGVRRAPGSRFEDVPEDDWLPVVEANLAPVIRTVQHSVRSMRRRGWGRIVLISSHNALGGNPGQEFYGSAKAGLHGLARSLMWDVGQDGILVNVVCPGLTTTERVNSGLPEAVRARETAATPTGRLSDPDDVARAVLFLGSAANGNITGESLTVTGGR